VEFRPEYSRGSAISNQQSAISNQQSALRAAERIRPLSVFGSARITKTTDNPVFDTRPTADH
jgi:hypothetical protein